MSSSLPRGFSEPLLATTKARPDGSFGRGALLLIGAIIGFTAVCSLAVLLLLPPQMATLAMLAYCFGCRHGVDADHIAAIDNVTRRLVAAGRRPMTVGVFFSLGHCAVVFAICLAVVLSSEVTGASLEAWASAGAAIGPWVAAAVLLVIGSLNLCAARDLWSQWQERTARGHEHEIASLVGRCCPGWLAAIDAPWKVVWVGLLFGLGLDTATEIGLLTLSALGQPLPRACALVLPLLFAAGMALVDSINGLLMVWAYEWAADNGPMHRLYFSLFLTFASSALAILVGAAEALGALATQLPRPLPGPPWVQPLWGGALWLSSNLEIVGLCAVLGFLAAIVGAVVLAPRCTPTRAQLDNESSEKLGRSLREYVARGEYLVRVEI